MSKIFFISYSSTLSEQDDGLKARQTLLNKSAVTVANADKEIAWTRADLIDSDFFKQNSKLLNQERGAGYWIWKPYIILQTLDQMTNGDWLIYSDVGKPFRRNDKSRCGNSKIGNVMNVSFDAIIDYSRCNNGFTPGTWVPHYGNSKKWTKRDCFVGMGCDYPEYHNSGHVAASYSCWSNTEASRDFLKQWLYWCQVEAIVNDDTNIYGKPNFDEFKDHRHDQSILTNLVIKHNIKLFNPQSKSLNGSRDFNLNIRHMALANLLATKAKQLDILFRPVAVLPASLHQALQLWLLPDIKTNSKISVQQQSQLKIWHQAFPDCIVTSHNPKQEKIKEEFTAVFVNDCKQTDQLTKILVERYDSLLPGGLLVMGPFDGKRTKQGKLNASFNELIQWIFINQRFPSGLSTKQNQLPNAITVGNAQNPLIFNQNNNKNYVILRKPHMNLSHL